MTEEQRRELYDILDYDEKSAIAASFETSRDAVQLRVAAELRKGSFTLKSHPEDTASDVISTVFESFCADFIQRPDNFEASISLGGLSVFDGTTKDTLHPQIVQVKNPIIKNARPGKHVESNEAFFYLKFESNPLDQRADMALTARMRHMEVIYHRGYVEAIARFLRPPESQLESVEALLVSVWAYCLSQAHCTPRTLPARHWRDYGRRLGQAWNMRCSLTRRSIYK